jgi:hypothetical protein
MALRFVGKDTTYKPRGTPDEEWLKDVGREGWLAISSNTRILTNDNQRQILVDEKVGIVFFTSGQLPRDRMLWLLLAK